jgi:beta-xylosidase
MGFTILFTFASVALMTGFTAAQPTRAIDSDFADPCVIQSDDGYYAFATAGNGVNVQVATSSDFTSWDLLSGTDAMPGPFPSWVASSPAIWAPDVNQRVSKRIES